MPLKNSQTNTRESPVKITVIGVLTLETDYKSEKGYSLDNSRHKDDPFFKIVSLLNYNLKIEQF